MSGDITQGKVEGARSRLAIALSVALAAHACLLTLASRQPQYVSAQAPGAIEVRIVPVTAAGTGHTELAAETFERAALGSIDATPPAIAEPDVRTSSRLRKSQVEHTRAANQTQAVYAPVPMMEAPPIATLQASPPSGTTYYADSEVDAVPVALDPIVPRYPSGSAAARDGGKVTLRLLIDATGVVRDVVAVEAEPSDVFEESARSALTNVRFKPAEKDGKAVGCQTVVSIVYAGPAISSVAR